MKWITSFILIGFLFTFQFSRATETFNDSTIEQVLFRTYRELTPFPKKLQFKTFKQALIGFYNIKTDSSLVIRDNIITIIDYNLPSYDKRLWVIDLNAKTVLYKSYVSHGKNSGLIYATVFSNKKGSHQSSLGFYQTGEIYVGKHGRSLYLNGLEQGINHNAKERAIVIHGAAYVSDQFVKENGRLGRSFGCPALPTGKHLSIIEAIACNTCLYIHQDNSSYFGTSNLLKPSSQCLWLLQQELSR